MSDFFSYKDNDIYMHYSRDEKPDPGQFKMHTHDGCEIYCFEGGEGIYRVEGTPYALEKGDILIMRPAEAHYIDVSGELPYTRLSVTFNPGLFNSLDQDGRLMRAFYEREMGTYNLYRMSNFKSEAAKICVRLIETDSDDRRMQTISGLFPLLNEISKAYDNRDVFNAVLPLESRIIDYINKHLTEELSLDGLSRQFFISKTQLCRVFKQATASTVGAYISVKRLVMARNLILAGTPPTSACIKCGFTDYSAFYRAYKKKYGSSPKMK